MVRILSVRLDEPEDAPLVSASSVIKAGGVIVYPTETLYGVGANALDAEAVERVHAVKNRTEKKPILVIVHAIDIMADLIEEMPAAAQKLIDAFWPGPLTLVFKANAKVPGNLTRGSGTIGIRIPSSALCLKLLSLCGCPLTSTSANTSGGAVLRSVAEIQGVLTTGVDLYLDAGVLPESKPSTVVDVTRTKPSLVREGAILFERIQQVTANIQR
jgi:L-threonylcarbamoyladenylate synthase